MWILFRLSRCKWIAMERSNCTIIGAKDSNISTRKSSSNDNWNYSCISTCDCSARGPCNRGVARGWEGCFTSSITVWNYWIQHQLLSWWKGWEIENSTTKLTFSYFSTEVLLTWMTKMSKNTTCNHSLHFIVFAQPIFALLKSISGCCAWNFFNISFFFISSDPGSPICFCLWSNIIFSTMPLVSPSKSPNLIYNQNVMKSEWFTFEFSGSIFVVSISGWWVITFFHHSFLFTFSRWMIISCWSSEEYQGNVCK